MTESAATGIITNLEQDFNTKNQTIVQHEVTQLKKRATFDTPTRVIKERIGIKYMLIFILGLIFFCGSAFITLSGAISSSQTANVKTLDRTSEIYIGISFLAFAGFLAFLLYKFITRCRLPIVTLEATGIRLPLFSQLIPWQAMDECDFYSEGRIVFRFFQDFDPGPMVQNRFKTKYVRKKSMVLCTFCYLKGIKPMELGNLMTDYQNAALARIRLAELGIQ